MKLKINGLERIKLNESEVTTNIGVLHEEGHSEAWVIAMDEKATKGRFLDYRMR